MVPNPVHRVPPKGAQGAFLALDPVHRVPAKNGAQGAPTNPVHRVPLLIRCTGCHYGFAIRCTGCPPRYKPRLKSTLCTGFFGTLCTGFFWGTLCTGPAPCAPEWPVAMQPPPPRGSFFFTGVHFFLQGFIFFYKGVHFFLQRGSFFFTKGFIFFYRGSFFFTGVHFFLHKKLC